MLKSPNCPFIQDILPDFSADQREFLLSGITPDEWDSMFPEEQWEKYMVKSYLLNKKYLHKLIDDLPEVIQVGEDGYMFYVVGGESVEIGKMGIVNEFSIFLPAMGSDEKKDQRLIIPIWSKTSRRLAKKIIKIFGRGRNMMEKFKKLEGFKIGDLVKTCDGLNSHVVEIEPLYFFTKRGKVLVDLRIITDRNSCSLYYCGVGPPISYNEAVEYRNKIVKAYSNNDEWGFAERYSNMIIHEDGTYTDKD